VRVRHIMDIGMYLGMPTVEFALLSTKISEQNALMVSNLLSKYNGQRIHTCDLPELPMLLKLGILPVIHGTPCTGCMNRRKYEGTPTDPIPEHP